MPVYCQDNWGYFFEMLKKGQVPDDFLDKKERKQGVPDHDPFDDLN